MLTALLEEESDLIVFMYREDNRMDEAILFTMDELDKALEKRFSQDLLISTTQKQDCL